MGERMHLVSPSVFISVDFPRQQETKNLLCLPGTKGLALPQEPIQVLAGWSEGKLKFSVNLQHTFVHQAKWLFYWLKNKVLPSVSSQQ